MALAAQLSRHAPITVSWPLGTDLPNALDKLSLLHQLDLRLVVKCRARKPHQPASFCDGETSGPATTDVLALRSWRACRDTSCCNALRRPRSPLQTGSRRT